MTGFPPAVHTARKLRRKMSLPEVLLWQELRRRPGGVKFRRQHASGDYVIDFYCAAAMLAVEIDGMSHDRGGQPERDVRRDAWLGTRKIKVVRVAAARVLADAAGVAEWVANLVSEGPVEPPLHHRKSDGPPPRAGEDFAVDISPLADADGGGFTGVAPELPDCRSDGATPAEALANTYDAIRCWLEAAEEMSRPVPQPRRVAA